MTNDSTVRPDVLVIGLGAMGSATTYQLAKRGAKVVGIDQFSPPHAHGSTHGETRITRQGIGEGRQFVPLAPRSHELWREIERETGRELLTQCGGLIVARAGWASHMHEQSDFFGDTVRAAREFGVAHELLGVADIEARYPQLALDGDETGYFEPGAGYLAPEACVSAQLELAVRHGATLHSGERVLAIRNEGGQTVVQTDQRTYTPGTTIVSAGPWLPGLLPQFAPNLVVRRQVLYWFETESDAGYGANEFPIFIWLSSGTGAAVRTMCSTDFRKLTAMLARMPSRLRPSNVKHQPRRSRSIVTSRRKKLRRCLNSTFADGCAA